jgi:uncharacterized membrane protein YphA (DoxX/SURF4 family)
MNRKLTIVLRSLLGLIFVAGPAATMFHAGEPTLPTQAAAFARALSETGYMMPLLWSTEIVAGSMLLTGILVPLALLLLAPVVVNIVLFHAVLAPSVAVPAALVIGPEKFLAWQYRRAFQPLFVLRADFGRPLDLASAKKQAA